MKALAVFGVGLGDEGKGKVVDYLSRRLCVEGRGAALVVRHQSGPQAAHNVVERNGRMHCFQHIPAGMLVPGVRGHISRGMLVKPAKLLAERDELARIGVTDAMDRLTIDPGAFVISPYHKMLGRMAELARGDNRHGSCGMGVGRAAFERESNPDGMVRLGDFLDREALERKVEALWTLCSAEAEELIRSSTNGELKAMLEKYEREIPPKRLVEDYLACGKHLWTAFKTDENLARTLDAASSVILETAQGVLLDVNYGFWPYVTKTDTTFRAASGFIRRNLPADEITRIGVLRAYATRHGSGPLVTEDPAFNVVEPHNETGPWQQHFRHGPFDLVTARYAIAASGGVDCLALTHLDQLAKHNEVRVCTSYEYRGSEALGDLVEHRARDGWTEITGINVPERPSREHQEKLGKLLLQCRPASFLRFNAWRALTGARSRGTLPANANRFIEFLESDAGLGRTVRLVSTGQTADEAFMEPDL